MKLSLVASSLFLSAGALADTLCVEPTKTCSTFDFSRFLGKWYQVGTSFASVSALCSCYISSFNKSDIGLLLEDSCQFGNDTLYFHGTAQVMSSNELKIEYVLPVVKGLKQEVADLVRAIYQYWKSLLATPNFEVLNAWGENGDYDRVLAVKPLFTGAPDVIRKLFDGIYVFSKRPNLNDTELAEMMDFAIASGYDPNAFIFINQNQCNATQSI